MPLQPLPLFGWLRSAFATVMQAAVLTLFSLGSAAAQDASPLKVMTFNVWTGEGSAAGRDKLAEIIATSGADIVGLQEMQNGAGLAIADELGMHYHQQSSGGIQVLSRYPIVGQSPANLGVEIRLAPDFDIWLFNAHYAPYPYQPYDLRDGVLPMDEQAVIAAANDARGGQLTNYLNDMTAALASGSPVFFTGDFNEPSHLDWTAEAAANTARPFDLQVEYPISKRIADAGFTDSFRAVRPDEVNDRGYTWTPGIPPPNNSSTEVHDRIDLVYHLGSGVTAVSAFNMGFDASNPNTDIAIAGYNSDHRAVVVEYTVPTRIIAQGDFDADGQIGVSDWQILRDHQRAELWRLTTVDAARLGDLNGDLVNDHADFVLFKAIFEQANGAGSFAAMLTAVPEPSSTLVLLLALLVQLTDWRPMRQR